MQQNISTVTVQLDKYLAYQVQNQYPNYVNLDDAIEYLVTGAISFSHTDKNLDLSKTFKNKTANWIMNNTQNAECKTSKIEIPPSNKKLRELKYE
jgi:hypothetical protein